MLKSRDGFFKEVLKIALPVTLQALLQSSFSVVDQIMTGQLGSTSVAGIGLGGKFSNVYSVLVSAVATVTGIMIAQYLGQGEHKKVSRSFFVNMLIAVGTAVVFTLISVIFAADIMSLYTGDALTCNAAAGYLRILAIEFVPMAAVLLISTLLRCIGAAALPLYASICAAVVNTGLNYILIFGKLGFPALGVNGAAIATVIAQFVNGIIVLILFIRYLRKMNHECKLEFTLRMERTEQKQYLKMLLPILACEFLWVLGENVYTAIYGNMGTMPCAAMTLTVPIQILVIGALSGVSQAAGVIIGKTLGYGAYDRAYTESKKLMQYGVIGSAVLSVVLLIGCRYYVMIYQVEDYVRHLTTQLIIVYAIISPVKVQNMILSGGIIRSGGKTNYVMYIDMIGTWLFGVPLGLLAAFVWKLDIPYVYFILSLEECVRLGISWMIFRKRKWMISL
ncbi:MAG: MATE family efflux transporter [bacterium]|nr:MATE family efflux transporter [bacterium]